MEKMLIRFLRNIAIGDKFEQRQNETTCIPSAFNSNEHKKQESTPTNNPRIREPHLPDEHEKLSLTCLL